MKKLIALSIALTLGGCASTQMQKVVHRPMVHVVPAPMPAPLPAPAAQPTVTVVPATPVPPATFKMRWWDHAKSGADKVRSHFHKKDK